MQTDDRFDRLKIEEGANKLKERYGQMGYLNAVIEISFANNPEGGVNVIIKIEEKQICELTTINYITNNQELQKELKNLSNKYLKRAIEQDLINDITQTLQTYLANTRYLVTTLSQPEIQYNAEKTLSLIHISEPTRPC